MNLTDQENYMIWDREAAHAKAETVKSSGKKIVFTNGCFDILHRGHVEYLQQARNLGDFLIVGLNSDKSISELKGSDRPLQNELDRSIILDALSSVDAIIVFDEDTPRKLIDDVEPDILVKGGDYQSREIAGSKTVLAKGGRVEIMPFISGISTSALIKKMQEKALPKGGRTS
ncbi:MAG: D-glycero-beta-D-manno-heptose 1-phosphate adenylyltransferase [Candidatus Neomarinimicrobiota bacterium]